MSRIKILSDHLANQIAAGEVVERPASVVKELLENSLDAGARRVQVEIEGSGTGLIKVIDDGMGMDNDDVLLCLERHATSKMGDEDRLSAIRSLGFRGEAIPSIASVSKMTILSRPENQPLGTQVELKYGKISRIHETGCNKGTVIEVRNLFGNMPVRKKFLKSVRTELFHIEEIIKNYSLACSGVGFTYKANNSVVFDLPVGSDTLEDRVRKLYGGNITAGLIPVKSSASLSSPEDALSIEGYLLSPEHSFSTSAKLRLFVNGRAVKDRMMAHGIAEGLSGYLMKGRSAAGAIFITLPYEAVDVNVHPTKQEIRFREPSVIHRQIITAVRLAMEEFQKRSKQTLFGGDKPLKRAESGRAESSLPKQSGSPAGSKLWDTPGARYRKEATRPAPAISSGPDKYDSRLPLPESPVAGESTPPFRSAELNVDPVPDSLKPVGQIMDLYLLCEARRGDEKFLVVIDQHAVHERILYENLKKQYESRQMASQNLLFPKLLELPPETADILEKNREQIRSLGIVVEEFGGDNYIIKAVPSVISHLDPEEILTGILTQISEDFNTGQGRKRNDATRLDDILSTMACKAAIKAGQNLSAAEMTELLKLMKESRAFTHCPHGRPVVRMFSATEIKRWFHRT